MSELLELENNHLGILDHLPEWDLSDLYHHDEDPQIKMDIADIQKRTEIFKSQYLNIFRCAAWTHQDLENAIVEYENISEKLSKLASYAGLRYYTSLQDQQVLNLYQFTQEKVQEISAELIFFSLDLNQISDEKLKEAYDQNQTILRYQPFIEQIRKFKPHSLSLDIEQTLIKKSLTSSQAFVRLYDETLSRMEFVVDGDVMNISEVVELMSDFDATKRAKGARALGQGLDKNQHLLTFIMNQIIKDKSIEDDMRGYASPWSSRDLSNQIETDVVHILVETVKESYENLSHRYYRLKAKLMNQDKIQYWDRNAPLYDDSSKISWLEARKIVLDSYHQFCPKLAEIGARFFDNYWIDVPVKSGKTSGAFAHPCVPSVHPYIMLNYLGKRRDVMTLAHELGHGIHQILASHQGYLLSDTPLTLAETASVFGEMLTFKHMLKGTQTKDEKKQLLSSKIEDMLNTVIRQIAFYDFEVKAHTMRKEKELSYEDLNKIWFETQTQALGEYVHVDEVIHNLWGYISHFYHSPFYVYSYAFGDCLVNSLYNIYEEKPEGFVEKYTEFLKAGGTKDYKKLLEQFELDPTKKDFWKKGLSIIESLIDDFEKLI
ncbi:MAG: oligoendopeptidase F [Candidatus Puniceispirillum sp.]|nr:oligoendopeptidase F [Candidatus Pelagibacter sp.]MBA4282703.1 oligoendopeptidase F [Candidatus Puniceispirillum sp.]